MIALKLDKRQRETPVSILQDKHEEGEVATCGVLQTHQKPVAKHNTPLPHAISHPELLSSVAAPFPSLVHTRLWFNFLQRCNCPCEGIVRVLSTDNARAHE